jgi:hypothetical protein
MHSAPVLRPLRALIVVAALASATSAVSPVAASAATIYACVKPKSGATRIVGAKARCKRGEQRLSWNTEGPRGPAGANGANGAAGAAGSSGASGLGPLFSAVGEEQIVTPTGSTLVSKVLPPGNYMIWSRINLLASSKKQEVESVGCELGFRAGTTGVGEPTLLDVGIGGLAVIETEPGAAEGAAAVPLQAPLTTAVTVTVLVRCAKDEGRTPEIRTIVSELQALAVTSIA